jgi:hypothetical protein
VPMPAGPIIIEITKEGMIGKSIFNIRTAITQIIPPKTEFIMNFFKKNKINKVATIKTIPTIINIGGFIGINVSIPILTSGVKLGKLENATNNKFVSRFILI